MEKGKINLLKEQIFFSDDFQKKWKIYLETFGEELDGLFGGDYDKKIRLSVGLEHLLNSRLNDAYHEIRHFERACVTETDKQMIDRLLKHCYNEEAMAQAKVGDWVKKSNGGYCRIIKRTSEYAIIKEGFDHELTYVKRSERADFFKVTLTDLKTYQFPDCGELSRIKAFFSEYPEEEKSFLKQTEKLLSFREAIIKAGFQEAKYDFRQFNFYRNTTENTAFVLNFKDFGEYIGVTYGFTSISEEDFFKNHGEYDYDIKLRFAVVIRDKSDEESAASAIKNIFDLYCNISKEDILVVKKEKQKEFLQRITEKLKPLGFKKKGTKWIKALERDFCLEFYAQKSQWSDQYYFNVSVYHPEIVYPLCYGTRLIADGKDIFDWQLISNETFNNLLNTVIESILLPIINTPLVDLGRKDEIWAGCACGRDKCQSCWVKK